MKKDKNILICLSYFFLSSFSMKKEKRKALKKGREIKLILLKINQ